MLTSLLIMQTYALDTGIFIEELLRTKGVLARGLAHPGRLRWGWAELLPQLHELVRRREGAPRLRLASGHPGPCHERFCERGCWSSQHTHVVTCGCCPSRLVRKELLHSDEEQGGCAAVSWRRARGKLCKFETCFGFCCCNAETYFEWCCAWVQARAIRRVQAYKGKNEDYKLFWPASSEFVRMAARFGATIVPFAAVRSRCLSHSMLHR